jgi:hypothetical protein
LPNASPEDVFVLFADDTACLTTPVRLQSTCTHIAAWFVANKLALNVGKTKHLLFSLKNTASPVLYLNDSLVESVTNFKFLGCYIDNMLGWRMHVENMCKKVSCGVAMLRAAYLFPVYVKKMIYFAYIYPFLMYSLAVWGCAANIHFNKLVVLQKRAIRLVYSMGKLDHVAPVAYAHHMLLLPELYELLLSCFVYRFCKLQYNASLFNNQGIVVRRDVNAINTRNSNTDFYVPFVRTSIRKISIVIHSINVWNALPIELKMLSSLKVFKAQLMNMLLSRYN